MRRAFLDHVHPESFVVRNIPGAVTRTDPSTTIASTLVYTFVSACVVSKVCWLRTVHSADGTFDSDHVGIVLELDFLPFVQKTAPRYAWTSSCD